MNDEWYDEKRGMLYVKNIYPCAICKKPTCIANVIFECHVCSLECDKKLNRNYMEALNK